MTPALARISVPAIALLAIAFTDTSAAADVAPTVNRIVDPNVVNTIPFIGCNGEPVTTTFVGELRIVSVEWPDGAIAFHLASRETATWQQNGVSYTAEVIFFVNDLVHRGDTTTFVTNGTGGGSDGSQVRLHDLGHFTFTPDGTPRVAFERGSATCD